MSTLKIVPNVGTVEIQQFKYSSGRTGFVARTNKMPEGDFFNLTVNIEGVMPNCIILKEYDQAQLVNKYLMESKHIIKVIKQSELGYNKIYICKLINKNFAT